MLLTFRALMPSAVLPPLPDGVPCMAPLPTTRLGFVTPPVLSVRYSRCAVRLPLNVPVVPVRPPVSVKPPKVGVLAVAMLCGRARVMPPALLVTVTWLAVPVSVARLNPLPLPISKVPLAAALPSSPVPPLAALRVPLMLLRVRLASTTSSVGLPAMPSPLVMFSLLLPAASVRLRATLPVPSKLTAGAVAALPVD